MTSTLNQQQSNQRSSGSIKSNESSSSSNSNSGPLDYLTSTCSNNLLLITLAIFISSGFLVHKIRPKSTSSKNHSNATSTTTSSATSQLSKKVLKSIILAQGNNNNNNSLENNLEKDLIIAGERGTSLTRSISTSTNQSTSRSRSRSSSIISRTSTSNTITPTLTSKQPGNHKNSTGSNKNHSISSTSTSTSRSSGNNTPTKDPSHKNVNGITTTTTTGPGPGGGKGKGKKGKGTTTTTTTTTTTSSNPIHSTTTTSSLSTPNLSNHTPVQDDSIKLEALTFGIEEVEVGVQTLISTDFNEATEPYFKNPSLAFTTFSSLPNSELRSTPSLSSIPTPKYSDASIQTSPSLLPITKSFLPYDLHASFQSLPPLTPPLPLPPTTRTNLVSPPLLSPSYSINSLPLPLPSVPTRSGSSTSVRSRKQARKASAAANATVVPGMKKVVVAPPPPAVTTRRMSEVSENGSWKGKEKSLLDGVEMGSLGQRRMSLASTVASSSHYSHPSTSSSSNSPYVHHLHLNSTGEEQEESREDERLEFWSPDMTSHGRPNIGLPWEAETTNGLGFEELDRMGTRGGENGWSISSPTQSRRESIVFDSMNRSSGGVGVGSTNNERLDLPNNVVRTRRDSDWQNRSTPTSPPSHYNGLALAAVIRPQYSSSSSHSRPSSRQSSSVPPSTSSSLQQPSSSSSSSQSQSQSQIVYQHNQHLQQQQLLLQQQQQQHQRQRQQEQAYYYAQAQVQAQQQQHQYQYQQAAFQQQYQQSISVPTTPSKPFNLNAANRNQTNNNAATNWMSQPPSPLLPPGYSTSPTSSNFSPHQLSNYSSSHQYYSGPPSYLAHQLPPLLQPPPLAHKKASGTNGKYQSSKYYNTNSPNSKGGAGAGGTTGSLEKLLRTPANDHHNNSSSTTSFNSPSSGNSIIHISPQGLPTTEAGWKARSKTLEMQAERSGKELEIARWRLAVLEQERMANEVENAEALSALAKRAQRAEARIKLIDEARLMNDSSSSSHSAASGSGSPITRPSSLNELGGDIAIENLRSTSPRVKVHPLAWLDLESVCLGVSPTRTSTNSPTTPNKPTNRRYDTKNRRSHGNTRNRNRLPTPPALNSTSRVIHLEEDDESDEELVIILDSPLPRRKVSELLPQEGSASFVGYEESGMYSNSLSNGNGDRKLNGSIGGMMEEEDGRLDLEESMIEKYNRDTSFVGSLPTFLTRKSSSNLPPLTPPTSSRPTYVSLPSFTIVSPTTNSLQIRLEGKNAGSKEDPFISLASSTSVASTLNHLKLKPITTDVHLETILSGPQTV